MSVEMELLLWSLALAFGQMAAASLGATLQVGLPKLAGNREAAINITGWAGRAIRAHRNMLESLVLFAGLVLAANAMGVSNGATVLGAQLFFWSRLGYAVVYLAGIPWLRTAVWAVSLVGLGMIFLQLI